MGSRRIIAGSGRAIPLISGLVEAGEAMGLFTRLLF